MHVRKNAAREDNTVQRGQVNKLTRGVIPGVDAPGGSSETVAPTKRATWEQAEGAPLPLGVTWIEKEQSFNFAVHSEHAESLTLLLFSAANLVDPVLTFRFDFLRNKSGRIWHCRIPITDIGEARYYAYSVSGETAPQLHSFDPQKVMRSAFSFRPASIANWQCEKAQTQAERLWEP